LSLLFGEVELMETSKPWNNPHLQNLQSLLFGEVELMETEKIDTRTDQFIKNVASLRRSGINGNLLIVWA